MMERREKEKVGENEKGTLISDKEGKVYEKEKKKNRQLHTCEGKGSCESEYFEPLFLRCGLKSRSGEL